VPFSSALDIRTHARTHARAHSMPYFADLVGSKLLNTLHRSKVGEAGGDAALRAFLDLSPRAIHN